METETLASLLFFLRLGVVTVVLWVASRLFDVAREYYQRLASRDAFVRAIYAEVDFNTFDMTRFLNATVPLSRFHALFEQSPDFVPHITDARHTDVYRSRISELHYVVSDAAADTSLVGDLVRFYGELEKVVQQIEGLAKDSFKQISIPGKVATVSTIYDTCAICEVLGKKILTKMEGEFPQLKLSRNMSKDATHDATQNGIGQLRQRLSKLSSDLDRINSNKH